MPDALGFFYIAKPPTGVILSSFPSDKAHLENIHQKKSTCGSLPRTASHTVMNLAMCNTLVELRCCSSRPHSLRSPRRNQCAGYPNPRSWKARKETTSPGRGCGTSSLPGALHCATSFDGRNPFMVKASSTDSLIVDDLQPDILLQVRE